MARITVNGIGINHRIEGREGRPWVTFSNSLATSLDLWDAQAAVAGAGFVLLDPAGHISKVENPDGFNRALGDFVNSL